MPSFILSDNGVSSGSAGLKSTAGNDGVLALQTSNVSGTATTAVTIDTSQNVGVGVTPSASTLRMIQGPNAEFLFDARYPYIVSNATYNSGWIRTNAEASSFYVQATGTHQWHTAPTGSAGASATFTQAMTLDASGNLGIGTTSPTVVSNYKSVTVNGTTGSLVDLASNGTVGLRLQCDTTYPGGAFFTLTNQPMIFGTNGTERARIDSSGNLLVGTTSAIAKLGIVNSGTGDTVYSYSSNASNTGAAFSVYRASTSGYSMYFNVNGNEAGKITHPTQTTTSYATSSDYRMKENVQPMTGALTKVAALRPVTYTWKIDGEAGEGFIAHELAEVCPHAVVGEKDAVKEDGSIKPQGIDTSFLVATLTAAIQELKTIVDAQAVEIAALKGNA